MDIDQNILALYIPVTLRTAHMRYRTGEKAGLSSHIRQRNIIEAGD